jgi:hypothetical protein
MIIKKLKAGMTVYEVRPSTGLQSFNGKWSTYTVMILEIYEEKEQVFASWNGNKAQLFNKRTWSKWRLNQPKD